MTLEKPLASYQRACRKGTDWLLKCIDEDGAVGPTEQGLHYYRVPWALVLMGEVSVASRTLDWIRHNMFSTEGEFEGVSPRGVFESRYGSYPLACLLVGASMLRRFDVVYPGTRRLLTWQDPSSGGFFSNRADMSPSGEQELFPTCQGGMTLLMVGQIGPAKLAGEWLKRLWELQPDPEEVLFSVATRAQGLVRDYPAEEAAVYVTRKDDPWQHHFNGGIAAAFLAKLHMATGDDQWLDLACQYQQFSMTTDDCQFRSKQTCKSGWGSGLLYVATREKRYRDWTLRLGDWFLEHQFEDGHWENTKHWTPRPTLADDIEITTEFVMHLANITANLSVLEKAES